jgi:hypothetical protein
MGIDLLACCDENSKSIKGSAFLDQLRKQGLYTMEFIKLTYLAPVGKI